MNMRIKEPLGTAGLEQVNRDINDDHMVNLPAASVWAKRPPPPEYFLQECVETMTPMPMQPAKMNLAKLLFSAHTKKKDASTFSNLIGRKERAETFQSSMKVMIICGQIFGLIPVSGITDKDATKLRFTYMSWKFSYTAVSFVFQFLFVFVTFKALLKNELNIGSATAVIFYSNSFLVLVLFVRVAFHWPSLARNIATVEGLEQCKDKFITKRCNIACFVVLSMAFIEHLLSEIAKLAITLDCRPDEPVFKALMVFGFPWIFDSVPYNDFLGVLITFVNQQCAFNWNFTDLFVINMSFYLTARFEQINQRINAVRGKYLSNTFWKSARKDYYRSAHLVRQVDDVIGPLVFLSFANNLYFVCFQLFSTLQEGLHGTVLACDDRSSGPLGGYEHAIYFTFSFVLLLSRSLAVSIYVAKVNSAAKIPAAILYDVPSSTYTIEVKRFLKQVTGDNVSLSGMKFFNVTRGLVLKVAGTIVTYELVLLQFNSASSETPTSSTPTMIILANASTTRNA